jgi:hypothetical protein
MYNLTSIGPCIIIYSYSTTNVMHLLSQIIYSCKTLYMFRRSFYPSPGAKNCVSSNVICQTAAVVCCSSPTAADNSSCLTNTVAPYTVLSSWWWTERPSETCRAFYKNKSFEITGAYCWLYYKNACTSLREDEHLDLLYNPTHALFTL